MPPTVAENLRRAMEECGVDPVELARRLAYKNRATVDHWLAGRRKITRPNLERAMAALGHPVRDTSAAYTHAERKARAVEKKALTKPAALPIIPSSPHDNPPPKAGADMDGGVPDQELFEEIRAVWRLLRSTDRRQDFVEAARGFLGVTSESGLTRAKKARR